MFRDNKCVYSYIYENYNVHIEKVKKSENWFEARDVVGTNKMRLYCKLKNTCE